METKPKGKVSGAQDGKLMQRFVTVLSDYYSHAIHFKLTHEEISEELARRVWNHEDYARMTNYAKGYVRGYHECKRGSLWNKMFWLLSCDGELLTSKEVDALTKQEVDAGLDKEPGYRSPWSRIDSNLSRHVWVDSEGKPLRDKPFDRKFR